MNRILFDMDGVLVDVSRSYRVTVQKTVEFFSRENISNRTIQNYKNRGGLNNDWDLTECILRERGLNIKKERIVTVFQEIYLGKDFNGLIRNEKWLLDSSILGALAGRSALGIVTGRPRMETGYVLQRFNVGSYFSALITMDDIPKEKQKPHPLGIEMAMARLPGKKTFYVGDTVDDIMAAKRANVIPIGIIPPGCPDVDLGRLLFDSGARYVLGDINNLNKVLL